MPVNYVALQSKTFIVLARAGSEAVVTEPCILYVLGAVTTNKNPAMSHPFQKFA